ncbi:thiolproteinase SmTP1, putative [Perkinsus marinus ATCC 50983]|uniref:Thiolproteinase SmTP1, putative n=1 Tax=Perkinsus marinus (strain ATCC 50983 / TXsc) TaxID=423536 RepID=C5LIY3_PERM5|nr:thiolproteinase SmTP1, putative [Perkinsus marinus ATCC 50983]EER03318.1 thiolproteinase SmTP1, putative [Perkinsus marinus ATCC 50983]|eukprot:XP_002771502.1 thiolproteinase SmTP1, putative [Perkinsus marinus ATCC 50983]
MTTISVVFLLAFPVCKAVDLEAAGLAFIGFQKKHGKSYDNKEEEMKRAAIFHDNLNYIEEVNAQNLSYKLGVNEYTDLTLEEFAALKLSSTDMSEGMGDGFVAGAGPTTTTLPTSVDWRKKGVLNPVKDQGYCGSCWAFSAIGALEPRYAIATGKLLSLSEQQLVDCAGAYGNEGCNGGLMDKAFEYIKATGVDKESTYPYVGSDETCQATVENKTDGLPVGEVTGNQMLHQTEKALMEGVAAAPVSIAMYANLQSFQHYKSGVYSDPNCNAKGGSIDHGVVAVGYGTENGQDYFIIRNSWGRSWGQDGYVYLKRGVGSFGQCNIYKYMCVPTLKSR